MIITTCNRPEFLVDALDSVFAQTRPVDQVIVIDAGDMSCQSLLTKYSRVQYRTCSKGSPAIARNVGLDLADGDYINFLDDDDWLLPTKLSVQCRILDTCPEIDLVYCRLLKASQSGRCTGQYLVNHRCPRDIVRALLAENFILVNSPVFRRDVAISIGGFDESLLLAEDYDFWLRMALAGARFHFCDETLATVRIAQHSRSRSPNRTEVINSIADVLDKNSDKMQHLKDGAGREWWRAVPHRLLARQALEANRFFEARVELAQALSYSPWHPPSILQWCITFFPSSVACAMLRARNIKRRLLKSLKFESRWGSDE